jgi:hypothetical protein
MCFVPLLFSFSDSEEDSSSLPSAPPVAAVVAPSLPAATAVGDYSHFNQKLSISDFDLLKVIQLFVFGEFLSLYIGRCWGKEVLEK